MQETERSDHQKGLSRQPPAFRADIEGLRAICVIAVILSHAFAANVPGGFIGVDIFFVISGYLITQLLLNEHDRTGSIDLLQFAGRRVRRILPVATLVLVCTAISTLFLPTQDGRELGRHIVAAALFFHNIWQARVAVDYLGAANQENPLLHYWSLSVEEQFYLVWPLILFCLLRSVRTSVSRYRQMSLPLIISALWAASFAYSVITTTQFHVWAFFDPLSRAYQLLTGSFLAAVIRARPYDQFRFSDVVGLISLAAIVACFVGIEPRQAYPGSIAAIPTVASALLLFAGLDQGAIVAKALSNSTLRYVGRISFSWYLWHWPLLVFTPLAIADTAAAKWSAISFSFALAGLTYRCVEKPFREVRYFSQSLHRTYALAAGLVLAGVGTGVATVHFAPDLVPLGNGDYVSAARIKRDRPVIYEDRCLRRFEDVEHRDCHYGILGSKRTIVLLGDSHAGNWFEALNAAARDEGWGLLVRIKASCRPLDISQNVSDGGRERVYTECADWLSATLTEIEKLQPQLIIVASTRNPLPIEAERRVLERLAKAGSTIVIRDTPWFPQNAIACLRKTHNLSECAWPLKDLLSDDNYPKTPLSELPTGVKIMDLNQRICPRDLCSVIQDRMFVMFDAHHLTASFSRTLSGDFRSILRQVN